ncbi:MAG: 50S ribosomal protein L18 [Patescibacteria group bacterium]
MKLNKKEKRILRHKKIRKKIFGTKERPRLSVFRSNQHIYAQVIDDNQGKTIVSASSLEFKNEKLTNKEKIEKTAQVLAQRMKEKGIEKIVFDRGGFSYKGRIKLFAEKLRELGIKF